MTTRIQLQPVYVLHHRPYSNTSLIVEFFSKQHGRISALARSARGPSSRFRGNLQLFTPMLASWSGRSDLMNLNQLELNGMSHELVGNALMCGFYLNELLMRLVQRDDPYPLLFDIYQDTLNSLEKNDDIEITLRCFEKRLLERLGYGLPLLKEAREGEAIRADRTYQYIPEQGFIYCDNSEQMLVFSGASIIALREEQLHDAVSKTDAKRLLRMVLARYLGDKPLKSRDLLR